MFLTVDEAKGLPGAPDQAPEWFCRFFGQFEAKLCDRPGGVKPGCAPRGTILSSALSPALPSGPAGLEVAIARSVTTAV